MLLARRSILALLGAAAMAPRAWALGGMTIRAVSGRAPAILGTLAVDDPAEETAALAALRVRTGYLRPLTYSSTDRAKAVLAIRAIDHFCERPGMTFAARLGSPQPGALQGDDASTELRELAAFLTGCVYGAASGNGHPLKRALVDRLLAAAPAGKLQIDLPIA